MLPLDGIRILDLSRVAPGRFCSMLLGDMGADVLMIEAPPGRLHSGGSRPPASGEEAARAAAHNALSRNKRSIVLDLQQDDARAVFHTLAAGADVVLEGFRPGVAKRLCVDYETLAARNPRVICCSISGYGQDGPYAGLVGHDINYIALGGALGVTGAPGSPPAIPLNIVGDFAGGGLHAAYGILLALMARERTGRGQYVDIAMSDGVIHLFASHATSYFSAGVVPQPGTSMLNGGLPYYGVYQCKGGGWISLGSLESHFFANLCRVMGREDLISEQHNPTRFDEMREHFAATFSTRTRDEWFAILQQSDICAAPVQSLDEVFADPHTIHRKMVVEVEPPSGGTAKQIGIAPKLSETPGRIRSIAPLTGQHTDEVLRSIGLDDVAISALRAKGAVA